MHSFHFYHGQRLGRAFTDFWLYEVSIWMHTLSHSLVAIFIPILLLKSGYSIAAVVSFYVLFNVIDVPLNFLARALVRQWGARIVIAVATIATIAFFWLLLNITGMEPWKLVVLAALAGFYDSFYWVAHFYLFIQSGGAARNAGKSTGILHAVRQAALIAGPALGAGILIFFSQTVLLSMTIIGLSLSLIPLLSVNDFPDKPKQPSLSFKQFFKLWEGRRIFFSTILYAVHDSTENTLFPMFIFVLFGTIHSVALISVTLSFTAIIVALLLGRIKRAQREQMITLGALLIAALWVTRIFFGGTAIYYASILAIGICAYFVLVPLDSSIFEYGVRVGDPLSASMYRNISFMATNVVLYGTLALLLTIFEPAFTLAAVSLMLLAFMNAVPAWRRVRTA